MSVRLLVHAVLLACLSGLGLVLPASPAAACSCAAMPQDLAGEAEVAFVGVLRRQTADDSHVYSRLRVERVFAGEVHATQDVVSDRNSSCAVEWPDGARVVVLGSLDGESRIATDLCSSLVEGEAGYAPTLAALGEGSEPLAGKDLLERDGWFLRDWAWLKLVVAAVGLAVLAGVAFRVLRARRAAG